MNKSCFDIRYVASAPLEYINVGLCTRRATLLDQTAVKLLSCPFPFPFLSREVCGHTPISSSSIASIDFVRYGKPALVPFISPVISGRKLRRTTPSPLHIIGVAPGAQVVIHHP